MLFPFPFGSMVQLLVLPTILRKLFINGLLSHPSLRIGGHLLITRPSPVLESRYSALRVNPNSRRKLSRVLSWNWISIEWSSDDVNTSSFSTVRPFICGNSTALPIRDFLSIRANRDFCGFLRVRRFAG